MMRRTIGLALGCALVCSCKTVRVYPLAGPQGDPQALFEPLIACATAAKLDFRLTPDALHVLVKPGIWAQFTPRRSAYTLVLVVDDGSSGGDREGHVDAAKRRSEALFSCARPDPMVAPVQAAPIEETEVEPEVPPVAAPVVTPVVTPGAPEQ